MCLSSLYNRANGTAAAVAMKHDNIKFADLRRDVDKKFGKWQFAENVVGSFQQDQNMIMNCYDIIVPIIVCIIMVPI